MKLKPSDLKVANCQLEALWTRVRDNTKQQIENLENELIIAKEMLWLSKKKALEAKRK